MIYIRERFASQKLLIEAIYHPEKELENAQLDLEQKVAIYEELLNFRNTLRNAYSMLANAGTDVTTGDQYDDDEVIERLEELFKSPEWKDSLETLMSASTDVMNKTTTQQLFVYPFRRMIQTKLRKVLNPRAGQNILTKAGRPSSKVEPDFLNAKLPTLNRQEYDDLLRNYTSQLSKYSNLIAKAASNVELATLIVKNHTGESGSFYTEESDNEEGIIPPKGNPIVRIEDCEPITWYSWPNSKSEPFKSVEKGIGAGEAWAAETFGGSMQGQGVSFDLTLPTSGGDSEYDAWEVKEYTNARTVRLGKEGTIAVGGLSDEITEILQQLKGLVRAYDDLHLEDLEPTSRRSWLGEFIHSLKSKLNESYRKFVISGQLTRGDLAELQFMIVRCQRLHKLVLEKYSIDAIDFVINGKNVKISPRDYAKLLYRMKENLPDELSLEQKMTILTSIIDNPVLSGEESYNDALERWGNVLNPSDVFGNVKGVILSHPRGFMVIPRELLSSVLTYTGLTQGRRPNYRVDIPEPDQVQMPPR
jgi:hypothetical protein